jgi:N-acetylneuraminic acid mutarotase
MRVGLIINTAWADRWSASKRHNARSMRRLAWRSPPALRDPCARPAHVRECLPAPVHPRRSTALLITMLLFACSSPTGASLDAGSHGATHDSGDAPRNMSNPSDADRRDADRPDSSITQCPTSGSDASAPPDSGIGGSVVLFGGNDFTDGGSGDLDDTWTWDGRNWTQHDVTGPSARDSAAMARANNAIVLFGGEGYNGACQQGCDDDTWTWDGASWTQQNVTGPSERFSAAAAALHGAFLLFGGFGFDDGDDTATYVGDTWTWKGTRWIEQNVTGPGARYSASAAPLDCTVVLFGGFFEEWLDDTWTWDGASWTQQHVRGPSARAGAAMATLNGSVVLFGGFTGATAVGDTWTWDGATWTQHNVTGPSARSGASIATLKGTVVLFGGEDSTGLLGDTWTWDGTSWTRRDVRGPSVRSAAAMSGP